MVTNIKTNKVIYPELSYKIVGILFKVHSTLGNKYQEKYYQRAIAVEFKNQDVNFEKELCVDLDYGGCKIGKYFLDFLVENKIVLEIKTTDRFRMIDFKQVEGYLKSKKIKLGILCNFRKERLEYKRVLNPDMNYIRKNSF